MIKRGTILINYLDSIGQFSASHSAHKLFVYADIEDHRERIDSAAQGRQEPFKEWFGGQERVYLPFGENKSQSEDKEVSLRKEFPDILKWIKEYLKEDPEEASLLQGRTGSGRKLGGKFFSQILRRRLAGISRGTMKIYDREQLAHSPEHQRKFYRRRKNIIYFPGRNLIRFLFLINYLE